MQIEIASFRSTVFRRVIERAGAFGACDYPVLILGETGVGKELIAQSLHRYSSRLDKPFVPVNCGALPPQLFESELFGYERGAFTGALQSQRGIVRSADGGTLFLDEVGELDLNSQVKLLRLLEAREVRSLGATRADYVNVRIIAATNMDLELAVKEGRFRQDLLERLGVLSISVPALRERKEDLALLAAHISSRLGSQFTDVDWTVLKDYDWPGNVRQLRNLLIRADVLGKKVLSTHLIVELMAEERSRRAVSRLADSPRATLAEIEKQVIVERLARHLGNRKKVAKELGIAKSTLQDKLRKWKAEVPMAWPGTASAEPCLAV